MIYTLHVFDSEGICLFYREWYKPQSSQLSTKEEQALIYGIVYSIKTTLSRLVSEEQMTFSYKTDVYKLHYYETATRLKWILTTGLNVGSMQEILQHMYSQIYVPCIALNPLYVPGQPLNIRAFIQNIDKFVQNLAAYRKT